MRKEIVYVAITRAEQECYLTYASQRWKNGQVNFSNPSRFLKDIDRRYLQQLSAASTQPSPWVRGPQEFTPWGEPIIYEQKPRYEQPRPVPQPASAPRSLKPTTGIKPKSEQQAVASEWKQGDRIDHKVFGRGTVQRVYRENDNEKIEIDFDTKGTKTLLLAYAKLNRV